VSSSESQRASGEARRDIPSRAGREGDDKHSNALLRYLQALYTRERRPQPPKPDEPHQDDEQAQD
jgi:hypothetical protein